MIPVVTPEEMGAVDRAAPEPVEVLIGRAGTAVAAAARRLLSGAGAAGRGGRAGGVYGRRVVVVAGTGNNGNDGRAAAALLAGRGVKVVVVPAGDLSPGESLPPADLIVDAAYGTGLARPYGPPDAGGRPVLAVDIPSGVSGLTGLIPEGGGALPAVETVTFGALKPGLLFADGPGHAGTVTVADIGLATLATEKARAWLVDDSDLSWLPPRGREAHKWQSAVAVVGGSPGMAGAPGFVSRGALRAGAGYVRLGVPGAEGASPVAEAVGTPLPARGWADAAVAMASGCKALVVGPGLGRAEPSGPAGTVGQLLAGADLPAVVDADGLNALGDLDGVAAVTKGRQQPLVLTPHEGEFTRLTGAAPGADRLAAASQAAARSGAVVLLKGATTVVAAPDGRVLLAAAGSPRLATAGTGDVLSGVLGGLLARGVDAWHAAALAAHIHGRAAGIGPAEGLVASDLPDLVSAWLSSPR